MIRIYNNEEAKSEKTPCASCLFERNIDTKKANPKDMSREANEKKRAELEDIETERGA